METTASGLPGRPVAARTLARIVEAFKAIPGAARFVPAHLREAPAA